ncbi:helix-turn-helix transcriptional regulator [Occultella gossypii]|uniref:ArsR family transcriptional regulator n=1 Tax=Occultella gossypii TaxID=2800820 RepID=A0ABS7SGD3_9MICO|nr:helix-turn-helix domain-containing protein [Occultella gossypii]MBZ2198326.1 ArsR family transcriptional regulator [Occultella gossypii]
MSAARGTVLDLLAQQSAPCTVGALAQALHQHQNTVREHLDALIDVGLATRTRAAAKGRGRPAWLYAATEPDAPMATQEYVGLATALAAQIARTSADPQAAGITAGRYWGQDLARRSAARQASARPSMALGLADAGPADAGPADSGDAYDDVLDTLDGLGFDPDPAHGSDVVRLRRCPLLEAAHRHEHVVCGVHLGMVQGLLEESGADPVGVSLEPFAERGACVLHLPEQLPVRVPGSKD